MPVRKRSKLGVGTVLVIATALAGTVVRVPAADAETGAISGKAFQDTNRDGVHQPDEAVSEGHRIYLFDAGGGYLAQSTTDTSGRYSFTGLAEGAYRVQYDSTTWNALRLDWFPTTAPLASPPRVDLVLDGAAILDWGFRPIVRSIDAAQPISEHVGPSGLRVQSYVDVVDASTIHDVLATGLLGPEAAHTKVRFGLGSTSTTSTSSARMNGTYVNFSAIASATYLSWVAGGGSWTTVAHEYGHAWSYYHATMTQQTGSFDTHLEARGLTGDPRLGSSHAWSSAEMIAEDYRQLHGPLAARGSPQENRDIAVASAVPGLGNFLARVFNTPPAGSTDTDTTAPFVRITSPAVDTTVTGSVPVVVEASDDETAVGSLMVSVVVDGTTHLPAIFDTTDGRYRATLDSALLAEGGHILVAEATDAAGNTAVSPSVPITVKNVKGKGKSGGTKPSR